MKLFKIIIGFFLLNGFFVFGQQMITHKVIKGDTFYGIAKKYDLKITDIYSFNPEVKDKPLPLSYELQLPNKKYIEEANTLSHAKTHTISKGDTFYKISKTYNITIQNLTDWNPNISSSELKIGYVLQLKPLRQTEAPKVLVVKEVPIKEEVVEEEDQEEFSNDIIHVVKKKETLYGIAIKNKTTVNNLKVLNPEITGDLPLGYHLVIKKGDQEDEVINENENDIVEVEPSSSTVLENANILIDRASGFIGVPYRYGGTTKKGMDCSGLMIEVFKEIDLILPRSSGSQAAFGTKIKRKQAQKGDLIFFATTRRNSISHVGMITEVHNNEIKFIHSSTSSGVIISSLNEPYYVKRFKQVTRVLN
jgi:cell wall-associated NlpC family hydrolase